MTRSLHAGIASSVVVLAFVGCNAILDNQPGLLVESNEGGAAPTPSPAPTTPEDGGTTDPPTTPDDAGATTPDAVPPCPAGEQRCAGTCVSQTDPHHGCGSPSCTPCPSAHGSAACQGRKCIVSKCNTGYADCNASATDGCETDLSKSASCGACNAACAATAPLCAPVGPTFQCTNGCPADAPVRCGPACVDPMTSTNHCGACNHKCAEVANAVAACAAGVCSNTCNATFHACAGTCVANTDATACGAACIACPVPMGGAASCVAGACGSTCPATTHACAGACVPDSSVLACGAACTVCPAVPNAAARCTGGACAFTCALGFGNCDANAANGCEATLASDPLNCGACGSACAALQLCLAGACL